MSEDSAKDWADNPTRDTKPPPVASEGDSGALANAIFEIHEMVTKTGDVLVEIRDELGELRMANRRLTRAVARHNDTIEELQVNQERLQEQVAEIRAKLERR